MDDRVFVITHLPAPLQLRFRRRGVPHRLGQPRQLRLALQDQVLVRLVRQHVLVERREERGQPLVDLPTAAPSPIPSAARRTRTKLV
jgi:hypothetical protein